MRKYIKYGLAFYLNMAGINSLNRFLNRNNMVIFTYHHVLPREMIDKDSHTYSYRNAVTRQQFDWQIRFLKREFHLISLSDIKNAVNGSLSAGDKPKALITFDDGFANNFLYAFPIMKKYATIGHFFLTTDHIGTRKFLWTEEVNHRILSTSRSLQLTLNHQTFNLRFDTPRERERASAKIRNLLKKQPKKLILDFLEQLRQQTKDVDDEAVSEARYRFMTWEQVKEMVAAGMIVGSHTTDHFLLSNLNKEEVQQSLSASKESIEKKLNTKCEYFSYPNGEKEDFSQRDINILKQLGYSYSLTQIPGYNTPHFINQFPHELKRINITNLMKPNIFKAVSGGVW